MAQRIQSLEELIRSLPADLQQEVFNYAKYLSDTRAPKPKHKLKFDWAGGLSDLRDQFTSVELQHDILKNWDEDVSS